MVDFHIKQFRKELKAKIEKIGLAYLTKHRLHPETKREKDSEESTMSPEEIAEILSMMDSLDDVVYLKGIES